MVSSDDGEVWLPVYVTDRLVIPVTPPTTWLTDDFHFHELKKNQLLSAMILISISHSEHANLLKNFRRKLRARPAEINRIICLVSFEGAFRGGLWTEAPPSH